MSLDVKVLDDSPVRLVDMLPAPDDQERSLFEHQVGDTPSESRGFATSRAGDDTEWTFGRGNRLALLWRKSAQIHRLAALQK